MVTLGAPLLLTETGEQVRFRTRKHFALLIRLAVEAGRKFTRDYLVDLLWSDAPPRRASHSLAQAISVLKAKVGREHVLVQKATVALADGVVDADVRRLDGRNVEIRGPFLDGFEVPGAASFEQWKDERRARLMAQLRDCLVTQMDAGRRVGDFGTVERHALVLHDLDPLSEDAVRGLMEARAWVGDRSNALKVFGRFEVRLAEELGATPSPDLVRIANLLREGRGATPRRHGEEAAPEPRERRFEAETLIGREREFSALYDAWLEARRRTPQIIVLTGDPGIGKTTLTNAFLSTCQMEGAVVIRAQAYDAERELPFAVLAELVKQLALQRAIGGADPEALAELSRLSPEIPRAFPGVPKPPDWSADVMPLRFADAFLKMVEAAAEESPLVVVVDDIHAADNASAAIVHMVARKLPRTRLMLILTARPSELRTAAAPAALVTDATVEALRQLELEPLGPEAAERLVAAVATAGDAGRREPPTERIVRASRGNPFAIELLTREWASQGPSSLLRDLEAMDTQPVASLGIPRAISAVFERQVRRLDAACHAALDLAAVLGRRLSDLSLYETVGLTSAHAVEALSRLREEGFLREVQGELEFRNELIRGEAYYHVTSLARQHIHRRTADLLAARPSPNRYSDQLSVAWHYLRGGAAHLATPHAITGAEGALSVGAPCEAQRILEAVLRENAGASEQTIRLLLAKALLDQSKAEPAIVSLKPLLHRPNLCLTDLAEATRLDAAAESMLNRDTGLRQFTAAERALEIARRSGDLDLIARALYEYARSGSEAGDATRVQAAKSELETLATASAGAKLPIANQALGYCHYFFHDLRPAATSIQRAIDLLKKPVTTGELSLAYTGLGVCHSGLCEFDLARGAYLRGLELAEKCGDDGRASILKANLSVLHRYRGEYREAVELALDSISLGTKALSQPYLIAAYNNLAEAYLMTGDRKKALECLEEARSWTRRDRSWKTHMAFLCASISLALTLGNLGSAIELIALAEANAAGRETAVPDAGGFETYRVFRAGHVSGTELAFSLAKQAREKFLGRHTLYYLDAVAATAWAERRSIGRHSTETERELELFSRLPVPGKRALLEAQGFLCCLDSTKD